MSKTKVKMVLGAVALAIALAGFAVRQTGYAQSNGTSTPKPDKSGNNGLVISHLGV